MSDTTGLVVPRKVTGGGEGLVTHGGLAWLGTVADRVGLSAGLRAATTGLEWRRHHPGHTLGLIVMALADGAEREGAWIKGTIAGELSLGGENGAVLFRRFEGAVKEDALVAGEDLSGLASLTSTYDLKLRS